MLALTGLTRREFEAVLPEFEQIYRSLYKSNKTLVGKKRKRRAGGGRRGKLAPMTDKLLFVLVYQKAYPLQAIQAELFEMDQGCANRWIHRLLPILQSALDAMGLLPERDGKEFRRQERKHNEGVDLIIDGTERRRQRPKDPEKQALHYSGKKKAHGDKNVVVVNAHTRRVGFLSKTYPGKAHDKKIADHENITYPRKTRLQQDTGFQGYKPQVSEVRQPKKSQSMVSSLAKKSVPTVNSHANV